MPPARPPSEELARVKSIRPTWGAENPLRAVATCEDRRGNLRSMEKFLNTGKPNRMAGDHAGGAVLLLRKK